MTTWITVRLFQSLVFLAIWFRESVEEYQISLYQKVHKIILTTPTPFNHGFITIFLENMGISIWYWCDYLWYQNEVYQLSIKMTRAIIWLKMNRILFRLIKDILFLKTFYAKNNLISLQSLLWSGVSL